MTSKTSISAPSATPLPVTQIALGRFHHFHLARQLEARGRLKEIWSGYPRFKLKSETGVAPAKIRSFPWFYVPSVTVARVPLIGRSPFIARELRWLAAEAIDRRVAIGLKSPGVLIGLSSGGLHSGRRMRELGGFYICDRGSTHIRFQNEILREEYRRWNLEFEGVDPRVLAKEEAEYEACDLVTIPSEFCRRSFLAHGHPAEKLRVVPYGGRLDRFKPVDRPDPTMFTALFVGGVSIRKGVPYLLQAFARLKHPRKRLKIIGYVLDDMREVLRTLSLEDVEFLGAVPNEELGRHYSRADVLVLPSLEEGLSLVMAEAMACGCPVVASSNTGAEDLFETGRQGLIVPARSADALTEALQSLIDDEPRRMQMRSESLNKIKALGGFDRYGAQFARVLDELPGLRTTVAMQQ